MEQKLRVLLCGLLVCVGSGHVDAESGRKVAFGSKQGASAAAYENKISRVAFEPEVGAAPAPAPGPVTASSATPTGSSSMKWWLPPSTMPSFPLFPNPGGIPGMPGMPGGGIPGMPGGGMPGMPMPAMPGMPFHPWGAAPTLPDQAQPTPPSAAAEGATVDNPNPNQVTN